MALERALDLVFSKDHVQFTTVRAPTVSHHEVEFMSVGEICSVEQRVSRRQRRARLKAGEFRVV